MLDVMFELPSRDDVVKCIITKETISDKVPPKLELEDGTVIENKETPKESA